MSNILMAYPNIADDATVAGGTWVSTMPVTNLQDRVIENWARTSSAHISATRFTVTYSVATLVAFLALIDHNLSTAATVRWKGYSIPTSNFDCDFTSAALDSRLTCTRSGANATFMGSNGLVQTAGANVARFEYDQTTHACRGLLVEPTATNLCLQSNDLTNSSWTKTASTTSKTQTGPDGVTNSASMLQANINFTSSCLQTVTASSGTRFFSAWVKRLSGSGTVSMTAGNAVYVDITSQISSTWARIKIAEQTATNPVVGFFLNTSGDQIAVWGAQLETTCVTSAIETTTTSVTRNGDLIQATSTNFSSWYNQTEGTFAAAFTLLGAPPASTAAIYSAYVSSNYHATLVSTARSVSFEVFNGSLQASLGATVVAADTLSYIASSYKANDFGSSLNAAAASTDSSGSVAAPTALALGQQNGTVANNVPMILAKLRYWPTRMSNANLAVISTSTLGISADYDSGEISALPTAYVSATTAAQRASLTQSTPHKLTSPQTLQYWECQITDTANTDGYVQIGRLMVADTAFVPTVNMSFGVSIRWIDRADITESDSGAEYFYERPMYRQIRAPLDWLTETEAMTKVLEMQRTLGVTGELFVMYDSSDTTYLPNRSYLARMRELGALETPLLGEFRVGFELKELL